MSVTLAFAAPSRDDDAAAVAMARERFKEGVAFFDRKEFDKARVAFLQAYALKKHPAVLLNLAQSELRSNHEAEAAKHFSAYLREAKDASDAERQAADAGLSATKASVAEVIVEVDQPAAEVYVDNSLEGVSPLPGPLYVNPGPHTLEARKDGLTANAQINASASRQFHAELRFAPKAAAPILPSETPAGASKEPEEFTPGAGRKPFFKWLTSSPVGIVGLGLTGAGLGVGVATALSANHSYNRANHIADQIKATAALDTGADTSNLCTDPQAWLSGNGYATSNKTPPLATRAGEYRNACSQYVDATSSGDTLKTVATVGFIVSGAAAVGTIIYYFVDPRAEAKEIASEGTQRRLSLVPSASPSQASLTLIGTF